MPCGYLAVIEHLADILVNPFWPEDYRIGKIWIIRVVQNVAKLMHRTSYILLLRIVAYPRSRYYRSHAIRSNVLIFAPAKRITGVEPSRGPFGAHKGKSGRLASQLRVQL